MRRKYFYSLCFVSTLLAFSAFAQEGGRAAKKIVFAEQQIEGKIRRPQLVLIKAEQRPEFIPMVMQSLAGNTSVVEYVTQSVIERTPYDNAFVFNEQRIANYAP